MAQENLDHIYDVVKQADAWDRCWPGNLNVELLVRDLTTEVKILRERCERQADMIRKNAPLYR